ncbi:hypothetical protein [Asticcacaulis excentricus]|uniref:hypothetical protein n=1 Tax=Asticcacaulis excentricus TaxID=78587 RepID=UPI001576721A|nr:hypothetical protein [Asticcacaulis excentricus]
MKMAGGTGKSASLTVSGDGFRASGLAIQDDYHLTQPENPPVVALSVRADWAVLTKVRLLGRRPASM